ncbi:MAG: sugar phosphate nucleotidyltransferase, partial [Alphaproteobacteria bacterium]|nr:sugar phosphate nucleotidyltransferase [Alphaproteobacteria bacterium]
NVSETLISVHYMADHFEQFVSQDKRSFTQVSLVYEEDMLGTAGCLSLLKDKLDEPVLVTNGDILSSLNFESFANFHLDSSFDATIAVTMYEVNIPYGVVDTDEGGEFASITEKPTHTHMVAAGVYMVSPTLLNLLQEGENIDMPDLLARAREAGLKIGVYPFHEYWRDVGRPEDLKHADVDVDKGSV